MIVDKIFKGKSVGVIALLASIGFVVGSIYMYRIPLNTVAGQLVTLFLLLVVLIVVALCLTGIWLLLKKLFRRHD